MIIYDSPTVTYDDASYDYSGLFIGVVVSWAVVVLSSIVVESASLLSVMRKTTSEASTMHKTLTLSSPLNG
jgi:hypothetical protein